jgi:hypothetical protein
MLVSFSIAMSGTPAPGTAADGGGGGTGGADVDAEGGADTGGAPVEAAEPEDGRAAGDFDEPDLVR